MRRLPVGRVVRRAVHGQHDGRVSEAIGLALPGSAGAPAPYDSRDAYAEASGQTVMELLRRNLRPRDIVTRKALENAATVVAAAGGSTNAGLHLPAIANEAGIEFDLHEVGEIFKRTPYIADLKPGGRYVMKDLHDIGGVPVLMKALLDGGYLHGDCITVTGKTIAENLAEYASSRPIRMSCGRYRTRCRRPAASWCCGAISRRRGRS